MILYVLILTTYMKILSKSTEAKSSVIKTWSHVIIHVLLK